MRAGSVCRSRREQREATQAHLAWRRSVTEAYQQPTTLHTHSYAALANISVAMGSSKDMQYVVPVVVMETPRSS